jgi:hypothetical protein
MPKRAAWTLITAVYFIVLGAFFMILGIAGAVSFVVTPVMGVPIGGLYWALAELGLIALALVGVLFLRYTVKRWGKWEDRTPVPVKG